MHEGDAILPRLTKPIQPRKVALATSLEDLPYRAGEFRASSRTTDLRDEFFDSVTLSHLIDTFAFRDHNCVYVTPAEVGQARRVEARRRVEAN